MKLFLNFKITQKLLVVLVFIATLFVLNGCGSSKKKKSLSSKQPTAIKKTEHGKVNSSQNHKPAPLNTKNTASTTDDVGKKISGDKSGGKVQKVISTARSFIGTPYKYGGTTRSGMDCSGLLLNSFKVVDITLPRSSAEQSKFGKSVKVKDLQPGDLVFFATGKNKNQVTHVGLVTEKLGNDDVKFIHSSSTLGVVETNISGAYYQQRYLGARRVIN